MVKAPEVWVLLEEVLLHLQGLSQGHPLLDVLLTPALDYHVALLQGEHEIPHHVNDLVFSPFVHQIRLGQDPYRSGIEIGEHTLVRTSHQQPRATAYLC